MVWLTLRTGGFGIIIVTRATIERMKTTTSMAEKEKRRKKRNAIKAERERKLEAARVKFVGNPCSTTSMPHSSVSNSVDDV